MTKQRIALVTGGAKGIGYACAEVLAEDGARLVLADINAVGPGSIDTEMLAGVNSNPAAMEMVMSHTPLKKIGEPKDIADAVAFLASQKAKYITGETIYVDGGRLGMNYTC